MSFSFAIGQRGLFFCSELLFPYNYHSWDDYNWQRQQAAAAPWSIRNSVHIIILSISLSHDNPGKINLTTLMLYLAYELRLAAVSNDFEIWKNRGALHILEFRNIFILRSANGDSGPIWATAWSSRTKNISFQLWLRNLEFRKKNILRNVNPGFML